VILDLHVQIRAIQTASILRITQEGLGDPVLVTHRGTGG
jgi:hypothetical protein